MFELNDSALLKTKLFINGEWVESDSGESYPVHSPATNQILATVANAGKSETRYAINCANNAMQLWQQTTAKHRASLLKKWFHLVTEHTEDLSKILTLEQGKPILEARAEVTYGAAYIEWFAEEAKRMYGDVIPSNHPNQRTLTLKQPVGVVAAITPWNFPIAMITRKVAPALAAGCAVVIKPAEATPLCALALAELASRAGLPKGLLSVVVGTNAAEIGQELSTNSIVKKLSFTGSTPVGKLLLKATADTVKKVSMELGGNAPFIVFEDADIELAVEAAMASKFRNAGQTCVCANRFIVHSSIAQEFTEQLVAKVKGLKIGNGIEQDVTIGPLINKNAVNNMQVLVDDALAANATLEIGGTPLEQEGNYYPPTVLSSVTPEMRVFKEEIFGPIAPILTFDTEEQAISLANATDAGLASYIFTQCQRKMWRVSEKLENGIVGVNEGIISSEVAPFGGVKTSGLGREGSKYGLDDYTEIKYICIGNIEE